MPRKWNWSSFTCGVMVALLFGFSLYIRASLAYGQIFTGQWVKFAGVDAYYHLRLVDNMVRNFPFASSFDPYLIYPGGMAVDGPRFFDWLLSGIIWVAGMGSPTQETVDVVSAFFPAVLGALVVIPVYFAGAALFGRWAGLLGAAVIQVLPGEFLGRSVIGFTDHHVAEVLFTAAALWFLIVAVQRARRDQLTLEQLRSRDRKAVRPAIYGAIAGVWLGVYFLTWTGAPAFAFIISIAVILQFTVEHIRHRSSDYLFVVGVCLVTAAVVALPGLLRERVQSIALLLSALAVPALMVISRVMVRKGMRAGFYPLVLGGLGLVGTVLLYVVSPALFGRIVEQFRAFFFPTAVAQTTMEMQPLLFPDGRFSFAIAWGNFGVTIFLSVISLAILTYLMIRHGEAEITLLVVWSMVILLATLGQRRFAYYFAVNAALLSGYACWLLIRLANLGQRKTVPAEPAPPSRRKRPRRQKARPAGLPPGVRYVNISLAAISMFFFIFFVNFKPTILTASQARFAPSDAWMASLTWLRQNTPEPAGDPDFYYQRYEKRGEFKYPGQPYGVMSWWDYGYWITRIGHRFPSVNPSQDPGPIKNVSNFFLSQHEGLAAPLIQMADAAFIMMDNTMTTTKLWAIARWAGLEESDFYGVYHRQQETRLVPVAYFYPTYYRTMAARLYNFDGKAVSATTTTVISFEDRVSRENVPYKHITGTETFAGYTEAVGYVSRQKTQNFRIVSSDPFVSPVPLEPLRDYRLVRADGSVRMSQSTVTAELKIFQYTGERGARPAPAP